MESFQSCQQKKPTEANEVFRPLLPKLSLCYGSQPMGEKTGRQRETYTDTLLKDTGLNTIEEVANCMGSCDVWQAMSTEDVNGSWQLNRIK